MKRTISILSALALVFLMTELSFGQSETISASADVQPQLSTTSDQNVNFGGVQLNSSPVLDPNGTDSDVGGNATYGTIDVTGAAGNTQLIISWNQSTVTLDDGSGNTLTYTPDVDANSTDNAGTAGDVGNGSASATTETDGSGNLFIFIGGDLGSIGSSQATGNYTSANGSGDLSFTINYQ